MGAEKNTQCKHTANGVCVKQTSEWGSSVQAPPTMGELIDKAVVFYATVEKF